jgi:hypothetical protein
MELVDGWKAEQTEDLCAARYTTKLGPMELLLRVNPDRTRVKRQRQTLF